MEDALTLLAKNGEYEELYEVVKTAIAQKGVKTYRVEVLKNYSRPDIPLYSTRCYLQKEIEGNIVWVKQEAGWTSKDNSEAALAQALGFLPKSQGAAG
jgi:hypothetical protein